MALPLFNWNGGQPITANGNFCAIVMPIPQPVNQNAGQNNCPMIDLVTYNVTGGSATGTISLQELAPDRVTWLPLQAAVTAIPLAATPLAGFVQGPFLGVRIVVASLAVSTITAALLKGTVRQNG